MSTISTLSASDIQANAQATAANSKLVDDFDSFLTLLTTQLQNQDPLEPMDSSEFTNQLVQYSTVEQAIATNSNLETLLNLNFATFAGQAVGYIGKEVVAEGSTAVLTDGNASWSYEFEDTPEEVNFYVTNSAGELMYKETSTAETTSGTFNWDGKDLNGIQKGDGSYDLTIVATDADGNEVSNTIKQTGIVTGVDFDSDTPILTVNGSGVPLSNVITVREAATEAESI